MNRMSRRNNLSLMIMVLALGVIAGYQALAQRGAAISPPIIATVRIETLFDGLHQRAEAKTMISALEEEIIAKQGQRQEIINELEIELEDVVAANRREELTDKIAMERMKHQFWAQEARMVLEVEKALRLQELYKSVKDAIADLAEAEGYDIVMLNDSGDELPFDRESRMPAQIQILQQIATRKMLYLSPATDVTEDLIVRMNNAFRAAQQGP
jgi:Skp family chaperone for outer membrane proteins